MATFDLTLNGPLHQGEFVGVNREAALEWIPSDSLFAALVTAWTRLGADVAGRLAGFVPFVAGPAFAGAGEPPFLITSAFPRAGRVRFYPAPPRLPQSVFAGSISAKAIKKIRWVSHGVLEQLIQGEAPSADDDNFLHGKTTWLTSEERGEVAELASPDEQGQRGLWRKQVVPHVTVDRASNASNLFHTGRVAFAPNCGLWFAVRGQVDTVREALAYLMDAGLGGLRSTGHGAFSYEERPDELPTVDTGWGLCLSRYAPQTGDEILALQEERSAYRLVTVGGWCEDDEGHPWRRRAVRLVAEGALLSARARGGVVDVKPEKPEAWRGLLRPVYRSGLAFLIPAGQLAEAA
jgi:CRISPR-associated protein Csm4